MTINRRAKTTRLIMIAATILISSTFATMTLFGSTAKGQQQMTSSQQQQPIVMRIQNTSMSVAAPNAPVNNQSIPHQIVVALPIRADGKIWTGTATFTASKPIEVEVEHKYNPQILPDAKHGLPLNAKWIDNTTRIALSPMTMFSNTPVTITNNPISTGSFVFAGSALVFHKTDGVPFTVTYTLDAVANPLTK
ncbi:MAG: hypothetical protein M3P08_09590 [Thermoproteota archaeon]|nr:hypothetical protein [Thermoproteota archaeon]